MKNKLKYLVVAFTLGIIMSSCQKDAVVEQKTDQQPVAREMGALMLPVEEYAKIPLATLTLDEMLKALPASVFLKTPIVGDQGGEGSCVAWGTTYAARSITKFSGSNTDLWSNFSNILSPEYVYNQIKVSTCESGAYTVSGLDLLKNQGVCTWTSMPYTDAGCSTQPNATQKAEAANYKITYSRVNIDATTIKTHLSAGRAVVVAGPVSNDFMYLQNGAVLTTFKGKSLGGHCYCLVGYDDAKNAFKFQNSWTKNWGSAGFGWINYKNIKSWWQEAYVMYNVN
jgi:C1A family cysteine protease